MRTSKPPTRNTKGTPTDRHPSFARRENLARISEWCASTYLTPGEDRQQVYAQAQSYLKDALLTVTQHMCNAADGLAQTVELQTVELEGVDAMVRPPLPPPTREWRLVHPDPRHSARLAPLPRASSCTPPTRLTPGGAGPAGREPPRVPEGAAGAQRRFAAGEPP